MLRRTLRLISDTIFCGNLVEQVTDSPFLDNSCCEVLVIHVYSISELRGLEL